MKSKQGCQVLNNYNGPNCVISCFNTGQIKAKFRKKIYTKRGSVHFSSEIKFQKYKWQPWVKEQVVLVRWTIYFRNGCHCLMSQYYRKIFLRNNPTKQDND